MVRLVSTLALYGLGILALSFLYDRSLLLAGCLLAILGVVYALDPKPDDVFFVVGGAILGPTAEAAAIHAGAWTYAHPDFLGIPYWLPVAWGLACLLIRRLSASLGSLRKGGTAA